MEAGDVTKNLAMFLIKQHMRTKLIQKCENADIYVISTFLGSVYARLSKNKKCQ